MKTETLFSSYQPIQQYQRLVETTTGHKLNPTLTIKGSDAFLMKQVASCYPVEPTIIDLAATATMGISTIFWAAQQNVEKVVSVDTGCFEPDIIDWTDMVRKAQTVMKLDDQALILVNHRDDIASNNWEIVKSHIDSLSSPFFTLTPTRKVLSEMILDIEQLLGLHHDPVIFLFPLSPIGNNLILEAALSVCNINSNYQLIAPGDVSPFLATSQLGVIYKKDNKRIPGILKRVQQLYEGNFDFVSLLDAHIKSQIKLKNIDSSPISSKQPILIQDTAPPPEPKLTGHIVRNWYRSSLSLENRLVLRDMRMSMFTGLRKSYHKLLPLKTRLFLRDIRVHLIGR